MADYYKIREIESQRKLNEVIFDLPEFLRLFFTGIENTTSVLTRLNYAYDLRIFFNFLMTETATFHDFGMDEFTISSLDDVSVTDIERFLSYVSLYENTNNEVLTNHERGKARKLASIRSMYKYYFNRNEIIANIAAKVTMPKVHDKEIIRLEADEVAKMLDIVDNGTEIVGHSKGYHDKTRKRDLAIITLFLGTGIRISELVGLDVTSFDFRNNSFIVTRKGGNRTILYFSDEIARPLLDYIEERAELIQQNSIRIKDKDAMFYSLQFNRISIRAVQVLVKKYSSIATPLKNISPHKLRSTYGTALYRETQDIYIVADVLGHKDVNTTKKHYAAISDEMRRNASKQVILRNSEDLDD